MKPLKPAKLTIETPLEALKGLRTKTQVFVKRDDLNGLLISGNKARKLEYLIADAKRKKCDTLVTCGAVQSNHCRTSAAFAQHFGFECHLFLRVRGNPHKIYSGNLLLDELLGAEVKYVTPSQYERRSEIMGKYAQKLRRKGKKPYVIPEGGSNEIGALGYLDCMKEMADIIRQQQIEAIYCAVGSGGTYAGLLLGKKLLNLKIDLNGVIVCDTIEYFRERIFGICTKAIEAFNLPVEISINDIHLIDGYVGRGYGIPYPEELRTIRDVAKLGIILEPVYTGKTFHGMLKDIRKNLYRKVVFVHTGGIFGMFAYQKEITKAIRRR
ncbi:MAG: D-cysteine desulfhydrase family protein [bacterium]